MKVGGAEAPLEAALDDFFYEVTDFLSEADEKSTDYRAGVFSTLTMLNSYLDTFDIDQSRFRRPLPDLDFWFLGKAK